MKRVMKNKSFILIMFVLSVLLLNACSNGDSNESGGEENTERTTINYSHFWPSHHIVQTDVLEEFQAEIENETEGVNMEIYPAGQLGTPDSQYDMAVTDTVDMSLAVHGYTPGKFPLMSVSDLPFIAESSEEASQIIWELYNEFPELQAEHDEVTTLWLFAGEPNQLLSAKNPIEKLEDLEGLKVRSPSPISTELIKAWGGVPVSMPVNDIYESLDKGIIDAAMAGVSTVYDLNLHEVVDYITIGNFSTSSMFSVMSTNTFNSLSENDQDYFSSLGDDMSTRTGAALDKAGEEGFQQADESGIEVVDLSEDELKKWKEAAEPVVQDWISEMEGEGLPGEEVYNRMEELGD